MRLATFPNSSLATFTRSAFATFCLLMLCSWAAQAQNVVVNPGFETFTDASTPPWVFTQGGSVTTLVNTAPLLAHSGNNSGEYFYGGDSSAPSSGSATISQTLTTVVGQAYTLDFWMSDFDANNPATDPFTVLWNGSALPTLSLPNDSNYYEYTFGVTATGTSTDLSFEAPIIDPSNTNPGEINLDDVSVTPDVSSATPEPGSLALLFTSTLTGTALIARRRRVRKST